MLVGRRERDLGDAGLRRRGRRSPSRAASPAARGSRCRRRCRGACASTASYDAFQSTSVPVWRHLATSEVARIRSSVSASVVNSSLRKPLNSESVELRRTSSWTPDSTWVSSRPTVTTQCAPRRRGVRTSGHRSGPRRTPRPAPGPQSPPVHASISRRPAPARSPRSSDPVELGVGERGVLLGVGRQHRAWSPVMCASANVAAQRGRHVEVADLVPRGVADDADDAVLRLAVLVRSQDRRHAPTLAMPWTVVGSSVDWS